jgi:hypothetical protein
MFFRRLTPSIYKFSIVLLIMLCMSAKAEWVYDYDAVEGIEFGKKVVLKPQAELLGGYDNRVKLLNNGTAEGDAYADIAAAAELLNRPAVYAWLIKGRYGYRVYADESELNNDFYTVAGRIETEKVPFIWSASADLTKSLDYSTQYNVDTGQGPDSVLTYQANTRILANADAAYDKRWFGKTSIVPGYAFNYYHQQYESSPTVNEWFIQQARLLIRNQYSTKTRLAVGGLYGVQVNEDETGSIGTLMIGIEHRMTQRTRWQAQLGYALADYEQSGTDHGMVSRLRGNWAYTKKLDFYVFAGNEFQPGYNGGGARMVYRLGYGGIWQVVPKFSLKGTVLHDYQQQINEQPTTDPAYGTIRNFIDLKADYHPIDPLSLMAGLRFNDDQYPEPQTKVYVSAIYQFN